MQTQTPAARGIFPDMLATLHHTYGYSRTNAADIAESREEERSEVAAATGRETASAYSEMRPLAMLQILRTLGAKPGQWFDDSGRDFGRSSTLAYLAWATTQSAPRPIRDDAVSSCGTNPISGIAGDVGVEGVTQLPFIGGEV